LALLKVPRLVRVSEVPVCLALPAWSPTSFAIARHCVWYSMAFEKAPIDWYEMPRFAYALPSPARPPTSFAIRCCLGVAQNCMWFRLGPSTSSSHALCLVPSLPRLNLAATEGKVLGRENDCEAFARVSVRLSVYMCVRARATCAHVYVT
jgi:hypothetical protein